MPGVWAVRHARRARRGVTAIHEYGEIGLARQRPERFPIHFTQGSEAGTPDGSEWRAILGDRAVQLYRICYPLDCTMESQVRQSSRFGIRLRLVTQLRATE